MKEQRNFKFIIINESSGWPTSTPNESSLLSFWHENVLCIFFNFNYLCLSSSYQFGKRKLNMTFNNFLEPKFNFSSSKTSTSHQSVNLPTLLGNKNEEN